MAAACSWLSRSRRKPCVPPGDPSDSIYVVVSGVLGAYLTDQPGGGRLLRRIGAGEILGEIGFITGEPRAATVKALRNCELLRVSHDELRKLAPSESDSAHGAVQHRHSPASRYRGTAWRRSPPPEDHVHRAA